MNDQFSSVAQQCPTLCNPMVCSTPGFLVHHQLLELAKTHVHGVSNTIQPAHPPLSSVVQLILLLPSIFPSIRVFSKESVLLMWPKHWSFSIRHRPFHWDISTVFQDASSSPPPLFVFSLTLFFKSVASPLLISRGCKIAFDHILREKVGTPRLTGSSY